MFNCCGFTSIPLTVPWSPSAYMAALGDILQKKNLCFKLAKLRQTNFILVGEECTNNTNEAF